MIRRPVPWPHGAKVAAAITFDMDADSLVHIEHPGDSITRVSTISMLQYGPLVAVPRILEAYRRYGLKQTFFVPAWCVERYPQAVEAMVKDDHEVGFHGYIHEAPNALSRDEEHYWMQRSIAVIEKHVGRRPRGNRSPLYNFSINTADLLVQEGFLYDASLMGDDVPYILSCSRRRARRAALLLGPRRLASLRPLDGFELHVSDHVPRPCHGSFHGGIRSHAHRRRRIVDRCLASFRQRQAVALAQD
jgi:hypothetical protein